MRIWISATCLSKSLAISDWPSSFTHCIFVSTRLRRWYPLHRRHSARPKYFDTHRAAFRATALAVTAFHGLVYLRDGMTAWAPRTAMA